MFLQQFNNKHSFVQKKLILATHTLKKIDFSYTNFCENHDLELLHRFQHKSADQREDLVQFISYTDYLDEIRNGNNPINDLSYYD